MVVCVYLVNSVIIVLLLELTFDYLVLIGLAWVVGWVIWCVLYLECFDWFALLWWWVCVRFILICCLYCVCVSLDVGWLVLDMYVLIDYLLDLGIYCCLVVFYDWGAYLFWFNSVEYKDVVFYFDICFMLLFCELYLLLIVSYYVCFVMFVVSICLISWSSGYGLELVGFGWLFVCCWVRYLLSVLRLF